MSEAWESTLVRSFGFPAMLVHGDTMVLDRWLWLRKRLSRISRRGRLLDVGCGTGAFTIGAARLGFDALGLSWDERNQSVAASRAALCRTERARFQVTDVRGLGEQTLLRESFDVVICLECIEHILDDSRLMAAMAGCLKPGGTLVLTTPNLDYRPIDARDNGPWSIKEDGGHVRKGYARAQLMALCESSGLEVTEISYCSGFISQKLTGLWRCFTRTARLLAWPVLLPFRPIPVFLDAWLTRKLEWPNYSICVVAARPATSKSPGS